MKRVTRKHGLSYRPEYRAWQQMRLRCTDPKHAAWASYGGRGITVCARWLDDPAAFVADMGPKPSPKHELDRIDNDRGYEPGNCRWALRTVNSRNRRNNRRLTISGQTRTLTEWAERYGIPADTLKKRLDAGWTLAKAVSAPARAKAPAGSRAAKSAAWHASRKLPPGVKRKRGRFVARIRIGGHEKFLGSYATPEAAAAAYRAAKGQP